MKRNENRPARLLSILSAHAAIILSLMYLVLFVIDRINSTMEFINNDITKTLLAILAVLSISNGIALALSRQKKTTKPARRTVEARKAPGGAKKKAKGA